MWGGGIEERQILVYSLKDSALQSDHYFNLSMVVVSKSAHYLGFSSKGIYLDITEILVLLFNEETSLPI